MNAKIKEKIWFVFCAMFIVSYLRISNFTVFRFLAIGIIQIISMIYIIKNNIRIKYNKKIIIEVLIIILCMVISNLLYLIIFFKTEEFQYLWGILNVKFRTIKDKLIKMT